MSVDREFEGKDLEEALHAAAASLGIAEPELDYEILEQGRRGLFGFGARNVRIRVKPPVGEILQDGGAPDAPKRAARPERPPRRERSKRPPRSRRRQPRREEKKPGRAPSGKSERKPRAKAAPSPAEVAEVESTVQRMLELMGLELSATARAVEAGVALDLQGPDRNLLTQREGELISSLQFLLNRMARRAWPGAGRIHLACNGDRKHRDEELIELTREVVQQVASTGKTKRLHPMNAYERRLVHIAVREHGGLGSRSEGSGYLKRVRIYKQK